MAIDYIVSLPCEAKRHFGQGDCVEGSYEILRRLKCRGRAAALRWVAEKEGQDPSEIKATLDAHDRDGNPIQKDITLAELESEAEPLDKEAAACDKCPANFARESYGCFGTIHYPIPKSGEAWLLSRLQPYGTIGGSVCIKYMSESGVTGKPVRQMRRSGHFAAKRGGKVILKKGLLKSVSVTADQLLETILMVGDPLSPSHCFGILLWLGAIKVDGKVPPGYEDEATFWRLLAFETREDKERHTELELGPEPASEADVEFRTLVKAFYVSWVHGVPVSIWA